MEKEPTYIYGRTKHITGEKAINMAIRDGK